MAKKNIIKEVEVPQGVEVTIDKYDVSVKGPKGEVKKRLASKKITIEKQEEKVVLTAIDGTKNEKKMVHTFRAHLNNMVKGATEGFVYKLKVCSGHFPMNITVTKDSVSVKNLFGEKTPRVLKLKPEANVKLDGDIITVECSDKEIAGQTAADIEQLTRRTGFDRRIFQDGIYIIEKAGKELK